MSKKQIIILIVVGLVIFSATFTSVYLLTINKNITEKSVLLLKDYKLEYGTYIGKEQEYDPDKETITTNEIKLVLNKDTIGDQNYFVNGNSLYVGTKDNNTKMYEVTQDNEFTLLAGAGITFKLSK